MKLDLLCRNQQVPAFPVRTDSAGISGKLGIDTVCNPRLLVMVMGPLISLRLKKNKLPSANSKGFGSRKLMKLLDSSNPPTFSRTGKLPKSMFPLLVICTFPEPVAAKILEVFCEFL